MIQCFPHRQLIQPWLRHRHDPPLPQWQAYRWASTCCLQALSPLAKLQQHCPCEGIRGRPAQFLARQGLDCAPCVGSQKLAPSLAKPDQIQLAQKILDPDSVYACRQPSQFRPSFLGTTVRGQLAWRSQPLPVSDFGIHLRPWAQKFVGPAAAR